MKTNTFDNLFC